MNDHLPDLLEELAAELESRPAAEAAGIEPRVRENPVIHGSERLRVGFDLEEVVAEYNALRNCIQALAEHDGLSLEGEAGYIVNRVIDRAIGLAAKTFSEEQARQIQERRQEHLSFVVHDIKTPLSAIHLIAKLLENGLPPEAKTEECKVLLGTLQRNVQRLDELVLKVIEEESDISTQGPVKVERRVIDLWPLVQKLLDDLRPTAEVKMTKLTNAVPAEAIIKADANLLMQIIQNLVGNAVEHTSGGEITVGARIVNDNGALECWVSDTGRGIAADRLSKVFEKGETDQQGRGGTGLGLAIVKQYVEAHGGQITAESRPGAGATFRFTVPVASERGR